MVAFLNRMPAGVAGAITRPLESAIEPGILQPNSGANASDAVTEYGLAVVLDATTKKYRAPKAGDTALDMVLLTRSYPGGVPEFAGVMGVTPVDYVHVADVMKRGYMNVKLRGATAAAKGGLVYIRIAAAAAGKPLGGFEAAADGANTVVLDARSEFTGPAFTDSTFGAITEIAFNI